MTKYLWEAPPDADYQSRHRQGFPQLNVKDRQEKNLDI